MCYFVYLASPLTLSEVRAMLPAGLEAHALAMDEQRRLRPAHPDAVTIAQLVHGACSCDLVRDRQPLPREDESHLRRRFRSMGVPRAQVLQALDVHRRLESDRPRPPGYWQQAFARFVAEHARNAGPTLFALHFTPAGRGRPSLEGAPARRTATEVRADPAGWLAEERPTLVVPDSPEP